jgi:hypothetical protein
VKLKTLLEVMPDRSGKMTVTLTMPRDFATMLISDEDERRTASLNFDTGFTKAWGKDGKSFAKIKGLFTAGVSAISDPKTEVNQKAGVVRFTVFFEDINRLTVTHPGCATTFAFEERKTSSGQVIGYQLTVQDGSTAWTTQTLLRALRSGDDLAQGSEDQLLQQMFKKMVLETFEVEHNYEMPGSTDPSSTGITSRDRRVAVYQVRGTQLRNPSTLRAAANVATRTIKCGPSRIGPSEAKQIRSEIAQALGRDPSDNRVPPSRPSSPHGRPLLEGQIVRLEREIGELQKKLKKHRADLADQTSLIADAALLKKKLDVYSRPVEEARRAAAAKWREWAKYVNHGIEIDGAVSISCFPQFVNEFIRGVLSILPRVGTYGPEMRRAEAEHKELKAELEKREQQVDASIATDSELRLAGFTLRSLSDLQEEQRKWDLDVVENKKQATERAIANCERQILEKAERIVDLRWQVERIP